MKINSQSLANLTLLLVAIIWGGGFIAGKEALAVCSPMALLFFRFSLATIVFALVFRKKCFTKNKTHIKHGLILGLIQCIGFILQTYGLQFTTPGKQAFFVGTYVVFVPFIAFFLLKIKLSTKAIFSSLITLLGIYLLNLGATGGFNLGDALSLLFALLFATQIVLTGKFVKNGNVFVMTFYQFLVSTIVSLCYLLLTGDFQPALFAKAPLPLLYLGILNTVLAFTLQNIAQKYTTESKAALIISTEAIFGFIFSALIYKEAITLTLLLGAICIFGGILISITSKETSANKTHKIPVNSPVIQNADTPEGHTYNT